MQAGTGYTLDPSLADRLAAMSDVDLVRETSRAILNATTAPDPADGSMAVLGACHAAAVARPGGLFAAAFVATWGWPR